MTLNEKTLKLLLNRPNCLKIKQIEKDTGLPHGWLYMYSKGRIAGPNVNRIETLHNYLIKTTNDNTTKD